MPLILASDINTYYTRLNAVRAKMGLSAVTKPSTAVKGSLITYADMQTVPDNMTLTASQTKYIPTRTYTISGLRQHSLIMLAQDTEVKAYLTQLEGYCRHDANYSNYTSDYKTNYSNNSSNYSKDDSDNNSDYSSDDYQWQCSDN